MFDYRILVIGVLGVVGSLMFCRDDWTWISRLIGCSSGGGGSRNDSLQGRGLEVFRIFKRGLLHYEDPLLFCKFLSFLLGFVNPLIKEFKVFSSNLGAFAAIWAGSLASCFDSLLKLFQLLSGGSMGLVPFCNIDSEGDFWGHCNGIKINQNIRVLMRVVALTQSHKHM